MTPNARRFRTRAKLKMGLLDNRTVDSKKRSRTLGVKREVLIGRIDGLELVEIKR